VAEGPHQPGRCAVHTSLGHDELPLACRQFPRVTVVDPRGASVTLSHDCPTAAALLDSDPDVPATILTDAPRFPPDGEYVGLDARGALPPLLRRDVLMDWESWWLCEARSVDLLANADAPIDTRIARLRAIVADIAAWSVSDGPLRERVEDAFAQSRSVPSAGTDRFATGVSDLLAGRFLAAHAFASWAIHLPGDGLRSWMQAIDRAAALLAHGVSVGRIDLTLRHTVG
jgi:hypothetical protein